MRLDIVLLSLVDGERAQLSLSCASATCEAREGELRLLVVLRTSTDSLSTQLLAVSELLRAKVNDSTRPLEKPLNAGG